MKTDVRGEKNEGRGWGGDRRDSDAQIMRQSGYLTFSHQMKFMIQVNDNISDVFHKAVMIHVLTMRNIKTKGAQYLAQSARAQLAKTQARDKRPGGGQTWGFFHVRCMVPALPTPGQL